jgi:hypothetical protein
MFRPSLVMTEMVALKVKPVQNQAHKSNTLQPKNFQRVPPNSGHSVSEGRKEKLITYGSQRCGVSLSRKDALSTMEARPFSAAPAPDMAVLSPLSLQNFYFHQESQAIKDSRDPVFKFPGYNTWTGPPEAPTTS